MKKFFSILFLFITVVAFSQTNFKPDDLLKARTGKQTLVNDFAGILTGDQTQALEDKLVMFDDSTSIQIAVVIVPTLGGKDIADFNVELLRAWGVGNKNNNGVVLLIAKDDRKLNITTGYGLEGALPDVTAKQIIDEVIVPFFKGDDYYGGINNGINTIMQAVKGEYVAPKGYKKKSKPGHSGIFYIILIIIILAISSRGRGGGGTFMSRRGMRGLGSTIFWGSMLGSGRGGSGFGGDSSGGGFGGFGGGSGGGGGASGSW
ncbi:MAG: TPM domain-containing protein [Chitinophagaceae bacterium]|nr:TPM domain-containing protein [Chitinophagaceae bacterium]